MGIVTLKPEQQHLLHQVVNKFHKKGRAINRMGGKIGEIADNHRLVQEYVKHLENNGSIYSANMFKERLEKPMGLLAKFEKSKLK